MLIQATKLSSFTIASNPTLPPSWLVEPPLATISTPSPTTALIQSRHLLLQVTTLCSSVLCVHVLMSAVRHAKFAAVGRSDTVPMSEFSRSILSIFFTMVTTSILVVIYAAASRYHIWHPWIGLFPQLNMFALVSEGVIQGSLSPILQLCLSHIRRSYIF